jgi:hypothetical protein
MVASKSEGPPHRWNGPSVAARLPKQIEAVTAPAGALGAGPRPDCPCWRRLAVKEACCRSFELPAARGRRPRSHADRISPSASSLPASRAARDRPPMLTVEQPSSAIPSGCHINTRSRSAPVGVTTLDLFRCGNSRTPRMHRVRLPSDVIVQVRNGVKWVEGIKKGVSTFSRISQLRCAWWRLPAGSEYLDDLLIVVNDHDHHFAWQPACDMTLNEFQAALATLNGNFLLV